MAVLLPPDRFPGGARPFRALFDRQDVRVASVVVYIVDQRDCASSSILP
jgi:hypothetical protein